MRFDCDWTWTGPGLDLDMSLTINSAKNVIFKFFLLICSGEKFNFLTDRQTDTFVIFVLLCSLKMLYKISKVLLSQEN